MITGAVLAIVPMVADFENVWPSTMTWIAEDVLRHETVCHRPSFSDGPPASSAYADEPLKPHDACPVGWYSIFHSPPAVVYWPLRKRSQSGVAGALVVFMWIVTVSVWLPGLRSDAVGTVTVLRAKP